MKGRIIETDRPMDPRAVEEVIYCTCAAPDARVEFKNDLVRITDGGGQQIYRFNVYYEDGHFLDVLIEGPQHSPNWPGHPWNTWSN